MKEDTTKEDIPMLKLYSWYGVNCEYTCGAVHVISSTEDEARKKALTLPYLKSRLDELQSVIGSPDSVSLIEEGLMIECYGSA